MKIFPDLALRGLPISAASLEDYLQKICLAKNASLLAVITPAYGSQAVVCDPKKLVPLLTDWYRSWRGKDLIGQNAKALLDGPEGMSRA